MDLKQETRGRTQLQCAKDKLAIALAAERGAGNTSIYEDTPDV